MQTILAIECSTAQGSAAVYRDGQALEVVEFTSDRSHNSVIFQPLDRLIKVAGPDLIVVGTGPGSYSGIRVGIAAGIGLSLALNVPLVGVPSLTALGEAYGLERYAVTGDARRGSWWYAEVTGGEMTLAPVVEDAEGIAARTAGWPGQLFTLDAASPPFCQAMVVRPRADVLGSRAAALSVEAVARLAALEPEPVYLRPPFITVAKKAMWPAGGVAE